VLRCDQDLTSRPARQVKKTVAKHLVTHALAFWVVKNKLLQLIAQREFVNRFISSQQPRLIFSAPPALLPPLDFYLPFSDLPLWLIALYWKHA